jgi:UDP-glucose 4-epimerase
VTCAAPPTTWVVGAGGLLGSSVAARFAPADRWQPTSRIAWQDPDAGDQLARAAREFLDAADGRPWQVVYCAGAGVTSTGRDALSAEAAAFERLVDTIASASRPEDGALFLASSAGGVYAGAPGAPHDERTSPRAISPYGEAKLALEDRVARLHRETGLRTLVGRISNLYGPGQNLGKAQGLISHVVRAHLLGRPISIFVPLDTVRDNLYVTDAARLVETALQRLRAQEPAHVTKVLASGQGVTVGFLIAELGRLFKRRLRVVYRSTPATSLQARDLRMRSVVWPELDRVPLVPLPVGMRRTVDALTLANGAGRLA